MYRAHLVDVIMFPLTLTCGYHTICLNNFEHTTPHIGVMKHVYKNIFSDRILPNMSQCMKIPNGRWDV